VSEFQGTGGGGGGSGYTPPAPTSSSGGGTHYTFSAEIQRIQRALHIPADGLDGPQTQAAIKAFQSSHGLTPDGIVGPLTSAKLFGSSGGSGGASGGSGGGGAGSGSTAWENTPEGRAASFGWSQAVINSDPELKKLFAQATSQNWTPDHFVAKVRDTNWFKTHSDTARQALILQKADPATYNSRVQQSAAQIAQMARTFGASMTSAQLNQMASEAVMYGWTTDQLTPRVVAFLKAGTGFQYAGNAATYQTQYTNLAAQYGVQVSQPTMANWIKNTELGTVNQDSVKNYMVQQASSRYPALAQRLKEGETLQQIADPYIQSYSKILEVNPNTVNLNDNLIQQALQAKDDKGQPTTQSVWQFEQTLRQDPRYMKTQGAQDQAMQLGHKVLSDMGLLS
jgi:peptidoglycan hydrolase-like protein with peptidoglycan-binding domain